MIHSLKFLRGRGGRIPEIIQICDQYNLIVLDAYMAETSKGQQMSKENIDNPKKPENGHKQTTVAFS